MSFCSFDKMEHCCVASRSTHLLNLLCAPLFRPAFFLEMALWCQQKTWYSDLISLWSCFNISPHQEFLTQKVLEFSQEVSSSPLWYAILFYSYSSVLNWSHVATIWNMSFIWIMSFSQIWFGSIYFYNEYCLDCVRFYLSSEPCVGKIPNSRQGSVY